MSCNALIPAVGELRCPAVSGYFAAHPARNNVVISDFCVTKHGERHRQEVAGDMLPSDTLKCPNTFETQLSLKPRPTRSDSIPRPGLDRHHRRPWISNFKKSNTRTVRRTRPTPTLSRSVKLRLPITILYKYIPGSSRHSRRHINFVTGRYTSSDHFSCSRARARAVEANIIPDCRRLCHTGGEIGSRQCNSASHRDERISQISLYSSEVHRSRFSRPDSLSRVLGGYDESLQTILKLTVPHPI